MLHKDLQRPVESWQGVKVAEDVNHTVLGTALRLVPIKVAPLEVEVVWAPLTTVMAAEDPVQPHSTSIAA